MKTSESHILIKTSNGRKHLWRFFSGPGAFRLFLASLVVLAHTSRVDFGGTAVSVFFALSGYWIFRIWRERYMFCERPYLTFLISRIWRLLPVFLVAGLIATLVDVALGGVLVKFLSDASTLAIAHAVFSNLLILGYRSADYGALVPAWSLDIELQFYFLAPLLILLLTRNPRMFAGVGFAACLLSATMAGAQLFVSYFVYFGAGMFCAAQQWNPEKSCVFGSVWAALILILVVLSNDDLRPVLLSGSAQTVLHEKYNWVLNAVVAVLLLPFAFSTVHKRGVSRDSMFGDLSYIVYLLHWPAVALLTFHFGRLPPMERLPFVALTWAAAFLLSYLIWLFFDRPIDRLRSQFVKRRLRPLSATDGCAEKMCSQSG